jgi:large conductance mechanosensitive channel
VIIGAAFGKIVTSLVNDIVMPPIGALMRGVNFNALFVSLDGKTYESLQKAIDAGAPVIGYGVFINNVIQFLIIAACIFVMVKAVNQLKRAEEKPPAAPEPPRNEVLLEEIRDLLKKQSR